jgi:hypothetical protein
MGAKKIEKLFDISENCFQGTNYKGSLYINKEEKHSNKCPICGRLTHKESKYCIFHTGAEEKTEKEFIDALKKYIRDTKEDKIYSFRDFIFIGDINFRNNLNITSFKSVDLETSSSREVLTLRILLSKELLPLIVLFLKKILSFVESLSMKILTFGGLSLRNIFLLRVLLSKEILTFGLPSSRGLLCL